LIHARGSPSASTQCLSRILENLEGTSNQFPIENLDDIHRLQALRTNREFPFNQDRVLVFVIDLERIHKVLEVAEKSSSQQSALGMSEVTAPESEMMGPTQMPYTLLSELQVKCCELVMQKICLKPAGVHG